MWQKCEDEQLALLDYRTTPLEDIDLFPSQLLLGRRPRNTLPATSFLLVSMSYSNTSVKEYFNLPKNRQTFHHDKPTVKKYSLLKLDEPIRIAPFPNTKQWIPGIIKEKSEQPNSYDVQFGD